METLTLLYDTDQKKESFVMTQGNIVTFKEPFMFKGEDYTQIIVSEVQRQGEGVKLIGRFYDTPWFGSVQDLLDAIDWEFMEACHAGEPTRYY